MPVRACPTCAHLAVRSFKEDVRETLNYYCCINCGHVWYTPKDDPDAPGVTVTPGWFIRENPMR